MNFPEKLHNKLQNRIANNSFRQLGKENNLVDFSSNDYLGFSKSEEIFDSAHQYLVDNDYRINGATGSRLLSGNSQLYNDLELFLSKFHHSEAALVFNSGYDANLGLFGAIPQRHDFVLYDEYIHASIRDGVKLSNAKTYSFKHNNIEDLELKLKRYKCQDNSSSVYVVTESVFSMDGDSPELVLMAQICKRYGAFFIVDEAHALGVFNRGLVQKLGLQKEVFARIMTFGKALGCHGAAILGSENLKSYLINFARSFIYTTGLSPHSLATIKVAYKQLMSEGSNEGVIKDVINAFKACCNSYDIQDLFIDSDSAIHSCLISGNERVKSIAKKIQENGFDVKPILSPTVPEGQERLRFCLHTYNSEQEIDKVLSLLSTFVTHER